MSPIFNYRWFVVGVVLGVILTLVPIIIIAFIRKNTSFARSKFIIIIIRQELKDEVEMAVPKRGDNHIHYTPMLAFLNCHAPINVDPFVLCS